MLTRPLQEEKYMNQVVEVILTVASVITVLGVIQGFLLPSINLCLNKTNKMPILSLFKGTENDYLEVSEKIALRKKFNAYKKT